nr:hypothetical protein GCM10010200_038200 [Actinomadura rugatobispora]
MTRHSHAYHQAAPEAFDLHNTHAMGRNAPRRGAERISAGPCRSARDVLPPDAPAYLLPIVEALLSGQTDEAASKQLGISPRTFSRRVAELLEHLNAVTRFQGGVELVRRGCQNCSGCGEGRSRRAGRPSSGAEPGH